MRARLASLNNCAVPFLAAPTTTCSVTIHRSSQYHTNHFMFRTFFKVKYYHNRDNKGTTATSELPVIGITNFWNYQSG